MSAVLWLFGKSLLGKVDQTFRRDVVIEARAMADHDSRDTLDRVRVSTLVAEVRRISPFLSTVEEMARRIPGAQLKLYSRRAYRRVPEQAFLHRCARVHPPTNVGCCRSMRSRRANMRFHVHREEVSEVHH